MILPSVLEILYIRLQINLWSVHIYQHNFTPKNVTRARGGRINTDWTKSSYFVIVRQNSVKYSTSSPVLSY